MPKASMVSEPRVIGYKPCPKCGVDCEWVDALGREWPTCSACADAEKQERATRERQDKGFEQWRNVTPPDFQVKPDPERGHPLLAKARQEYTHGGAALIGPSGEGKTFTAYQLLKREAFAGRTVFACTHSALREAISHRHHADPQKSGKAGELINACKYSQAWLLDDLGKGASTETADEGLYEVLNYRADRKLTTIWTSQQGSAWLKSRFGPDRGPAIVTRLARLTPKHHIYTIQQ